jgi:hypothetical protein
MSRLDVFKSLVRSGVRSAASGVRNSPATALVGKLLADASFGRARVEDARLTALVAKLPEVAAATVSTSPRGMRIDVSFEDGAPLACTARGIRAVFATGGAKELGFEVEPSEALRHPRSGDVVSAIAAEIARTLWRPVLLRAPASEHAAFVTHEDGRLVVDLRSLPDVRWALGQRLPSTMIQALRVRAVQLVEGGLSVRFGLHGLGQP